MSILEDIQRAIRGEATEGFRMRVPPPVAKLVGFEAMQVERGASLFGLETKRDLHSNPMGTVHGGILCDLADAAMGFACASLLEANESFTTIDLRMTFLRPVLEGRLEARAQVVHGGKSIVYLECDITTAADGRLVAKASSTCMILRGEQARAR
jgi:uncharacterized protein (TIGR00369 family)